MKIRKVTIHSAQTFSNPYESYANFRPGISITATLAEDDDLELEISELQGFADRLIDTQKTLLLERAERRSKSQDDIPF